MSKSGEIHLSAVIVTAVDDRGADASVAITVVVTDDAGPPAATPLQSMEITAANPAPPSSGDWATDIVKQARSSFPGIASLLDLPVFLDRGNDFPVCAREWTQVTAPGEDYDEQSVAFSGWLLRPEHSGNDLPFTHPLGFDWECMVALDARFTGLLAAGNVSDDEALPDPTQQAAQRVEATSLGIPIPSGGFMAVEQDSQCVPSAFDPRADFIRVGDRIAVLGRWIVDTGHSIPEVGSYRAEVHPPMLMAIGGTRTSATGEAVTRIMLTSRPYLVKQVYTIDTSTIYNDAAADDGPFLEHINNEINKLHSLGSTTVEVHPKIASMPFKGAHFFRLRVRPPAPAHMHLPVDVPIGPIQVRFQFTCRSGVGVEVVGAEDGVDLMVSLNSVNYTPPPLPTRQTITYTKDELPIATDLFTYEQFVSIFSADLIATAITEHALSHGIDTDTYEMPDVNVLDQSHMIPFAPIDQIPGGQGIVVDDGQPYPVFGFLEIKHLRHGTVGPVLGERETARTGPPDHP